MQTQNMSFNMGEVDPTLPDAVIEGLDVHRNGVHSPDAQNSNGHSPTTNSEIVKASLLGKERTITERRVLTNGKRPITVIGNPREFSK